VCVQTRTLIGHSRILYNPEIEREREREKRGESRKQRINFPKGDTHRNLKKT
jgi:hypothetical protein